MKLIGILFTTFLLSTRLHAAQEQVTFYHTYGYREIKDAIPTGDWIIPVQLVVWEFGWKEKAIQSEVAEAMASGAKKLGHQMDESTLERLKKRWMAFVADNENKESVQIRFDSIPGKTYAASRDGKTVETDLDGRLNGEVRIDVADLATMPPDGWLSFEALGDHHGRGRARLLKNEGISIISDIDDTVKVTEIREGAGMVIMNTFFREYEATDGMQALYSTWKDSAFHYVSGGPWQLYTPISDFLKSNQFPDGSIHMRDFPLHPLNLDTWETLPDQLFNPTATFDHKAREISTLMKRFPGRKFILVGDSGEKDPEIYREIQKQFGTQVSKIIIRDVAHEPERMKGMEVLEVK